MALKGITVLELNGLAPIQLCGKILSDLGARIIRVDKVEELQEQEKILGNGKQSVAINLRTPKGVEVFKHLSSNADVLLEPYRPGVMEKLGLGPEVLTKLNKRLIYGRLSGYGQVGRYSKYAGHDINFLSLSGVLSLFGQKDQAPIPPCNVVADFCGGGVLCALGIVSALYEREKSGFGQVLDASLMRGTSYLATWIHATKSALWSQPRGENLLDGGAYMYKVYETSDGKYMSVGALEMKFYNNVLIGLNISQEECPYFCSNGYELFKEKFKQKTQAEWTEIFSKLDACVTPVLSLDEAVSERPEDYIRSDDLVIPQPEPRYSRLKTSDSIPASPQQGQHTISILLQLGYTKDQIYQLALDNTVYFPQTAKL